MRRTRLNKKGKSETAKLQEKLWNLCKLINRAEQPNVCYTCGKGGLAGANWHTGHMWNKAILSANLKYDMRVLRSQCYYCNINLGGRGADFYKNMVKEIGKAKMTKLEKERQMSIKADKLFYLDMIEKYEKRLKKSLKKKNERI